MDSFGVGFHVPLLTLLGVGGTVTRLLFRPHRAKITYGDGNGRNRHQHAR